VLIVFAIGGTAILSIFGITVFSLRTQKIPIRVLNGNSSTAHLESIEVSPPEKIVFIAYNIGVYESVQKFGGLITSGKITDGKQNRRITIRIQRFL